MPYRTQSEKLVTETEDSGKNSLFLKVVRSKHTIKIFVVFIILFLISATVEPFVFNTAYLFLGLVISISLSLLLMFFNVLYTSGVFSDFFDFIVTHMVFNYIRIKSIKSLLKLKKDQKIYLLNKSNEFSSEDKNKIKEKIELLRVSVK